MQYIDPQKLDQEYNAIRGLNHDGSVVLISSRNTGEFFVKRKLDGNDLFVYHTLSELHIPGIPMPLFFSETKDGYIIIEEYIDGYPLSHFLQEYGPINKQDVFNYLTQLCDILTPLHRNTPAIIHRDIKPSNVLLSKTGQVYLLDFDAATYYHPSKDYDTVLLGTHGYAAPEQYGFNASDTRTDIYALGRLAMTLLTGEACESTNYSGPYAIVLKRCTNMDPRNRYSDAAKLKRALLNNKNNPNGLKIPGYRSGNTLLAIGASIAYAFIPFFSVINLIDKDINNFLFGILFSIALIFASMVTFNYRDYLSKFPGTNSSLPIIRLVTRLFYIVVFLVLITVIFYIISSALGILES